MGVAGGAADTRLAGAAYKYQPKAQTQHTHSSTSLFCLFHHQFTTKTSARLIRSSTPAASCSTSTTYRHLSAAHLSLVVLVNDLTASMAAKPAETTPGSNSSSSFMADVYKGELTPLQRHVAFFDRNNDGIIYPSETYQGFRAIGAGVPLSAFSSVFINGLLGPKTVPENEKAPAFKLPIYVKNIQKGKHGSDSGVYDASGRFVPEKFEEIFKKHAHTRTDALTGKELKELLKANREPNDFKGWLGGFTEWKVLYSLCKDEKGFLHKDTVRAVYDGSLFEKLEHERKSKKESTKKK